MVTGTIPGVPVKSVIVFSEKDEEEETGEEESEEEGGTARHPKRRCTDKTRTRLQTLRSAHAAGEPTKPKVFDLLNTFYQSREEFGGIFPRVDHTKPAKEQDGGAADFFSGDQELWGAVLQENVEFATFYLRTGDVYYIPPGYLMNAA